jgi:hypothetical protein
MEYQDDQKYAIVCLAVRRVKNKRKMVVALVGGVVLKCNCKSKFNLPAVKTAGFFIFNILKMPLELVLNLR